MSALRLGVIGIGAFGSRIALRLLWTDFPTLQIYDVADQTPRMFSNDYGGLNVGSPKMMAQSCDVIITVLPSAAELREVCFGWEGLAKGFKPGGIVMDIGATDPLETVALGKELGALGVKLVDAPAFGTPEDAQEGKLTLIVGGDEAAIAQLRPVLEKLAGKVLRAGITGSAQAAGAIADTMRAVRLLAASEAIRLGAHFGFEAQNLLAICDALGGADLPEMLRRDVATRRFKTGQSLGIMGANVELATRLATGAGIVSPLMAATQDALVKAEARLGYGADQSAIIKWLEGLTPPPIEEPGEMDGKSAVPGPAPSA
jgi:3-hydroxyisobutyrate dehydrogenase-like beta-hydroxyacid dehydrogenase